MSIDFNAATVHGCIEDHCLREPEIVSFSLLQEGKLVSYTRAELWTQVEKYARLFASTFSEGSLILFVKRLDLDLIAGYIGAMKAGCIPAQMSPASSKLSPSEYRRKLSHSLVLTGAAGFFSDEDVFPLLPDVLVITPKTEVPIGTSGIGRDTDVALVQFSSGSTGLQKGVVLSHQGIIAHMRDYTQAIHLTKSDKIVSWLPLYHDMGLIACYLMPLMTGVPFIQMDPFDWILNPDRLLSIIEHERATLCFLPNFAYHVLINKGKPHDLSTMRLFINCSEPARAQTHKAFISKYPSVRPEALAVCYALAENTFAVSQTSVETLTQPRLIEGKEVLSCGRVLPGTGVKVLDPNEHGVGEIAIRGNSLFQRYLGNDLSMDEGFYPTGDLGLVTPERELFVTGRKKDLIIVHGKNIYPQDIEQTCNTLPGVYPGRSVAFGLMNEATGSEDLIVIVERDGSIEDLPLKIAIQKAVESEVGIIPKRVEIVDHMRLVKTSSGKISRSRNKELYLQGEFR